MKPRLRLVVDNGRRLPSPPDLSPPAQSFSPAEIEYMVNRALHRLGDLGISRPEKERLLRENLAEDDA